MAWDFSQQIHALTGVDADSSDASEAAGATFRELTAQWLKDAAKEVMNTLPRKLKIECATITSLTSSTPMDLDATGEIFHATRENADNGYHIGCREINPIYAGSSSDSTSLHYATATDPVYWIESDTGGDPKLFVKPDPTANQPARIHHVAFPSIDYDATAIVNFPNEAEYLVPLRAAITAAEYMLAIEEDPEIFIPMIQNLRKEYNDGLSMIIGQSNPKESKKLGDIQV